MEQRVKQRDIVLVHFPFSDASTTKLRPALVLSNDAYNASRQDVLVCAITSQTISLEYGIALKERQLESGTLRAPSMIRADTLGKLDCSLIQKRLGTLSGGTYERVLRKIHALIS